MRGFRTYCILFTVLFVCCHDLRAQEIVEKPYEEDSILKKSAITIRDIQVSGNRITKKYIVLREVVLLKGSAYSISDILANIRTSRQNLMNTSLFVDATVDFKNWFNDSIDIVIDVKERWYWFPLPIFKPVDRNWNVWINQSRSSIFSCGVRAEGKRSRNSWNNSAREPGSRSLPV